MCMKATFFPSSFTKPLHPHSLFHPLLLQASSDKGGPTLTMCSLSFSPAHFISSLHLLLLESTHMCITCVCECVRACFQEFVMVMVVAVVGGVYICRGSHRPRGQDSETLLWQRLWAVGAQQVILLRDCSFQHWQTAGGLCCVSACMCVSVLQV